MRLHFAKCMAAAYARVGLCAGVLALPSIPFERLPQANLLNYIGISWFWLVHHYHKDGQMRFFQPKTGNVDAVYEPNSFEGAEQDQRFAEPPLEFQAMPTATITATAMTTTARLPRRSICSTPGQKQRLFENVAETM
jgi:catalase